MNKYLHYTSTHLLWVIIIHIFNFKFLNLNSSSSNNAQKNVYVPPTKMRQGTSFDALVPYASCCRKEKKEHDLLLLTFPIFSSLSTLCKITFTSIPMRLYERCKHASNDFTLPFSSAIPRLYNSYQRFTRHKITKKKGRHTLLSLKWKIADACPCWFVFFETQCIHAWLSWSFSYQKFKHVSWMERIHISTFHITLSTFL